MANVVSSIPSAATFLEALLPHFSPDFGCLDVSYTDIASAVDNVVFVTYSAAWCAPFNDPIGCLSDPGSPCYPQGEGLVRVKIDKYNLACNDSMVFNDCLAAVINRTDAFVLTQLEGANKLDDLIAGTATYTAQSGDPAVTASGYPVGPWLPIVIFTGDVVSRPNTVIEGYPSDLLGMPLFDTMPYFTNADPQDCRGLTVTGKNTTLIRVGSAASVTCSSNTGAQFVRDFVLLRDNVTQFYCYNCSIYYPNTTISARHVGVYLASGGDEPLMQVSVATDGISSLTVLLSDWNITNDIMLWASGVTGLGNVGIASGTDKPGLQLVSSPDSGIWFQGMLNVTTLITPTTQYRRSAACPSTSMLHDAAIGGLSALGGIMAMGIIMGLHGYFHREHEHSKTHIKHMIPPPPKPDSVATQAQATGHRQPVRVAPPAQLSARRRVMRTGTG